jgi:hypothetical protein
MKKEGAGTAPAATEIKTPRRDPMLNNRLSIFAVAAMVSLAACGGGDEAPEGGEVISTDTTLTTVQGTETVEVPVTDTLATTTTTTVTADTTVTTDTMQMGSDTTTVRP